MSYLLPLCTVALHPQTLSPSSQHIWISTMVSRSQNLVLIRFKVTQSPCLRPNSVGILGDTRHTMQLLRCTSTPFMCPNYFLPVPLRPFHIGRLGFVFILSNLLISAYARVRLDVWSGLRKPLADGWSHSTGFEFYVLSMSLI